MIRAGTPGPRGGTAMDHNEPETFEFDVFLSHSSNDKPVVRDLGERLRRDGRKVWFDEWDIRLGDSVYAKISDGLACSRIAEQAKDWNQQAQAVMDSQSLEQILLGHVQAIAGEAGQIWRATPSADWGIDGEIEFKDYKGRATGRRIYLQLKSGNSYLDTRKKDGVEIFRIKKERLADYWQNQPFPVWLVIRTTDERSGSAIRWMDLSAYLRKVSQGRQTPIKQVEFRGEPLTAQSLMSLRDRIVPPPGG